MSLLGERVWWLPRSLDRVIPDVDIEGAALERETHTDPPTTVALPAPVPSR